MSFSVLMSVYHGTAGADLVRCLQSLLQQEKNAGQIILVQDGPISLEVQSIISEFDSSLPIENLIFHENRGLGLALRDGLQACRYELVARVDTDDTSLPHRFAIQTQYLESHPEISVVGSWMREHFVQGDQTKSKIRQPPTDDSSLRAYAKHRNPLNHPTVMFRQSDILSVGGYQPCLMFEDYFLWGRLLRADYRIANLNSILVETTVDLDYFQRRGGLSYLKHEIALVGRFIKLGFFSRVDALKFLSMRIPIRLLPNPIRKILYYSALRAPSPEV